MLWEVFPQEQASLMIYSRVINGNAQELGVTSLRAQGVLRQGQAAHPAMCAVPSAAAIQILPRAPGDQQESRPPASRLMVSISNT